MSTDDVKKYVNSSTDFYELLGVSYETSQKEIDRAWRRTALKYHPDKVGNDATAKEKFHLAQIGYDLLSDPAAKSIYDNARNARLQRQRQYEAFEGRRRQMKDDLEARERGVKRPRQDDGEAEEERLEREIKRLAEDGKRRRKEREEALRKEMQTAEQEGSRNGTDNAAAENERNGALAARVSELDRTVKIRWPAEGLGSSINETRIAQLFRKFGAIESVHFLNPKMVKLAGSKKKTLACICMLTYMSVVSAHAAVEDKAKQTGEEWEIFESVTWAASKPPEILNTTTTTTATNNAKSNERKRSVPDRTQPSNGSVPSDPSKKPSFASFSAAKPINGHTSASLGGTKGLNLEEMTMLRLRRLEQKRLAEELEWEDQDTTS